MTESNASEQKRTKLIRIDLIWRADMARLSLKQGSHLCQILFSCLIILDILAATNTVLPTIELMLEHEENRTESNALVLEKEGHHQQGVDIVLGVAEMAALAILIICNLGNEKSSLNFFKIFHFL